MRKTTTILSAALVLSAFITNARADWVKMDSLGGGRVYAFATMGDNIFAGHDGSGVLRSTDSGKKWTPVNSGLPNLYVFALAIMGNTLFAGSGSVLNGGGVSRSTDSGATWTQVNNGLTNRGVVSLAAMDGYLFAATGGGVFKSADSGASWTATGMTTVLVLAAASNGAIFAGTMYAGVYRSLDTGTSWTAVNNGMSSTTYMSALAVNNGYIFAAGLDYPYGGNPPTYSYAGIYRSPDNGNSWVNINNGLSGGAYSFAMTNSNVFAGTGAGVYFSPSNGDTWSAINNGLTDTTDMSFMALAIHSGYLFAGSYKGNIWRRPLSEIVAVKYVQNTPRLQKAINLHVDRNNMLRYTLAEAATVSLNVYDIRGRLLHSSMIGRQAAGAYSASLSASRLARGNYIIDFNAGDFRIQRVFAVM